MNIFQQDFITYCRDLYKITGGFLDNALLNQNTKSFSQLIDVELEKNSQLLLRLKQVDCCVIAHDGYECNPRYSHVGTYLANRYELKCDMFDVIGDGVIPALNVALHLIDRYVACQKIKSAIILEFRQSALPLRSSVLN